MQLDPVRLKVLQLIQKSGRDMKATSLAIGKNSAYMQQFLFRGTPRSLSDDTRDALAEYLGVDERELEHSFALPREARRAARTARPAVKPVNDPMNDERLETDLVPIPEVEVRAAAGAGALNDDHPQQIGVWPLSARVIEQELRAPPNALRVISVLGDSMLPTLCDGDRIMVDTSHRTPSPPGLYVLWDGTGLVTKRVTVIPGDPPQVRLHSDNQLYSPYDCHPDEINIVGRVVLAAKRM